MTQLTGHTSEATAYASEGNGIRYWVETKSPSKQVLKRKALWDYEGRDVLTAPVIVLIHADGHVQARYLNELSTEAEIEKFSRQYELTEQQSKWCFAALEEIAPAEVDHD